MRIFIAGPYSAETPDEILENVRRAMAAALALIEAGHQPYVPHLSHWLDEFAAAEQNLIPYDRWLQLALSFVLCCDALLCLGPSPGADQEAALAKELGLPVYHVISDIPPT